MTVYSEIWQPVSFCYSGSHFCVCISGQDDFIPYTCRNDEETWCSNTEHYTLMGDGIEASLLYNVVWSHEAHSVRMYRRISGYNISFKCFIMSSVCAIFFKKNNHYPKIVLLYILVLLFILLLYIFFLIMWSCCCPDIKTSFICYK